VLSGRMGEAIETTQTLYPTLLDSRPNLLFLLKVRQFIEMVGGSDSEVRSTTNRSPKSQNSGSPSMSPNYGGFGTSQGYLLLERVFLLFVYNNIVNSIFIN
jgi:hypothetical protein